MDAEAALAASLARRSLEGEAAVQAGDIAMAPASTLATGPIMTPIGAASIILLA